MATSGAMSTSNQYVKYKITITQNSQNVNANTSNVTVAVRFYRTNTGYTTYGSGTIYCKIDGTTYSAPITTEQRITSTGIVLFSRTTNISHNTNGVKTLTASAWISMNTPLTSSEQSYSQALTTIPRATTPTLSATTVNMGASVTITMQRASSSFDHTLRYVFGATSGTIGTGLATSRAWTVPLSLADYSPSATSGVLTIYCDTYNEDTKIGTKSVNLTITVPTTIIPSVSGVTVTEATPGLNTKFGAFVKNHSRLNVVVTSSGDYESSIISVITTACGNTYNGSSFTVDTVNLCDTVNFITTVKDSRGRTASYTKTISVLDYAYPTITRLRGSRCNQDGTPNDEGEYINLSYAFNITALNNRNDKSYTIEYKLESATDYTSLTSGSVYSADTSLIPAITFGADNAYNIKLTVADYFKTVTYEIDIPTAFTLVDYNGSGKGIAFGKVSAKNGMEIALPIYDRFDTFINNGLSVYSGTAIDPNTSLEELILTDHSNAPESGFFYIRTMFYSSKNANSNRAQVATPYSSSRGVWYRYFYNGTWSEWENTVYATAWTNLTLGAGWSVPYAQDTPQYKKVGDVVYLRGLINGTASASTNIATLPSGFRPYGSFNRFVCALNQTESVNIQVNRDGVISDFTKTTSMARTFISLNAISFVIQ